MARGQVFERLIPTEKPKRNGFDLSFANNFSTKFGTLTPVLCKEVIPGDTFNIDSAFGIKLMPMYFPVQTRMRARVHYFYVRNRNLWKNWKKFLRGDKSVVMPYISTSSKAQAYNFFKQGTLADYLGVPTTMVNSFRETNSLGVNFGQSSAEVLSTFDNDRYLPVFRGSTYIKPYNALNKYFDKYLRTQHSGQAPSFGFAITSASPILNKISSTSNLLLRFSSTTANAVPNGKIAVFVLQDCIDNTAAINGKGNVKAHRFKVRAILYDSANDAHFFNVTPSSDTYTIALGANKLDLSPTSSVSIVRNADDFINTLVDKGNDNIYLGVAFLDLSGRKALPDYVGINDMCITDSIMNNEEQTQNCFQSGAQKINALPFRAYESIFNAIYRNTQNDPFIKNGQIEYDDFITTDADGADSTPYDLYQDYWEKDFLTTCLPSPQDGHAPLLGFSSSTGLPTTASANYRLRYTTENGTQQDIYVRNNSGTLTFSNANNGGTLDKNLQGDLEALNSAAQFGISINDLRNVNSLQRWLEKNIANGYRYKDIIESHFGIEISLRELNMPEFIGGVTQDIDVNAVTQTSEDGQTPLGWQVGNGSAFGKTKRISKYCDEHGFIIGIFSVVPIPTYSQLLPKMFTKFGQLDYYTPEFSHIGLQPVPYREVCPIQAAATGLSLDTVFGYNRAFYDYLASTDEVHGEFRGSLRDFLMNRVFDSPPQLSKAFLSIDPKQTNNVFNVTMPNDDKIYGQIYFDIVAERPIPLYNEPRLE